MKEPMRRPGRRTAEGEKKAKAKWWLSKAGIRRPPTMQTMVGAVVVAMQLHRKESGWRWWQWRRQRGERIALPETSTVASAVASNHHHSSNFVKPKTGKEGGGRQCGQEGSSVRKKREEKKKAEKTRRSASPWVDGVV